MISLFTLISLGGIAYLYSKIFYHGFCENPDEQDFPLEQQREQLEGEGREGQSTDLLSYGNCLLDSDYHLIDNGSGNGLINVPSQSSGEWHKGTKLFPTFHKLNPPCLLKLPGSVFDSIPSAPPKKKSVRFHPISLQHDTFSRREYQRRNQEYVDRIGELMRDPSRLAEIYEEIYRFKRDEMNVVEQPQEEAGESYETGEEGNGGFSEFKEPEQETIFVME